MKKTTLILLALLCSVAFAQDLPRIAVYVTGDVPDNEKSVLGTRMLAALVNSGHYRGIERSNTFLAEIEREQAKQRSGAIDDDQISALGKQFGVKYVCIVNLTPAFGVYQLSARIVNVETAEVESISETLSTLKTAVELLEASNRVVKGMLAKPIPKTESELRPEPALVTESKPDSISGPALVTESESDSILEPALVTEPEPDSTSKPALVSEHEPVVKPEPEPIPEPELVTTPEPIPEITFSLEPKLKQSPKSLKKSFWIGLSIEAIGAGIIAYGFIENGNAANLIDKGEFTDAEKSVKRRNALYIAGVAALLSGMSITIFF
jgi:hypothetical protein